MRESITRPLIGVVGPCGSGKTSLTKGLHALGYSARHIAQEHSYVKDMWKRITNPKLLVFLDVSYQVSMQRRPMDWTEADYLEQHRRLSHARQYADYYLHTDQFSIHEVLEQVLTFLKENTP